MTTHKLKTEDATKFIFAGNATFTVVNTKTDNRFTFKVKKPKGDKTDMLFASVLTGVDTYTYIGICKDKGYIHGRKSVISSEAQSVKVLKYILDKLKNNKLPDFVEIWHEGKCGKCGRALTVPSSIQTGLGPECIKTLSKEEKRDVLLTTLFN